MSLSQNRCDFRVPSWSSSFEPPSFFIGERGAVPSQSPDALKRDQQLESAGHSSELLPLVCSMRMVDCRRLSGHLDHSSSQLQETACRWSPSSEPIGQTGKPERLPGTTNVGELGMTGTADCQTEFTELRQRQQRRSRARAPSD